MSKHNQKFVIALNSASPMERKKVTYILRVLRADVSESAPGRFEAVFEFGRVTQRDLEKILREVEVRCSVLEG